LISISFALFSSSRFSLTRISILCGVTLLSLAWVATAHAADRFWVGAGNADHDTSDRWEDTNNWSNVPTGTGGQTVPGASDLAIFAVSGSTVRIRSEVTVGGIFLANTFTGSLLQGTGTLTIGTSGIRVGSGTFLGGNGVMTSSGSFTQTGGIVTMTHGTYTQSGSFSITNGAGSGIPSPVFTSTGTVVFRGNTDLTYTQAANTTVSLWHVTVDNNGGTTLDDLTVSGTGGLSLSGTLTITLGGLDLETNNVTLNVENGITLADAAQATLIADQNITASGAVSVGAASTVTLSGSMTLTLNGDDQELNVNNTSIPNLTIGSSSGTTLTGHAQVTSTLQVNTGASLMIQSLTLAATGATIINYQTIDEGTGKIVHTATSFLIADSSYAEDDSIPLGTTVYFTITDTDENISGTAADTLTVTATTTQGESETITLTETSNTSGVFRGSAASADKTGSAITAGDGIIQAGGSDYILTGTFTDAQDALTNTDTSTLTIADSSAPPTSTTSSGGGGGGGGGRTTSAIQRGELPSKSKVGMATQEPAPVRQIMPAVRAVQTAAKVAVSEKMQERTCARVVRRFSGNSSMLSRITQRLMKRFGFSC